MYRVENQARLQECVEVGLNCEECVRSSASTTAMFCNSLASDGIDVAFRLMYHRTECQPMHASFYFHYIQAVQPNSEELFAATA